MNRLCELLEIDYPIIEGGMIQVGDGRLAGAISAAGALGQVGAGGRLPEEVRHEIRRARELTTKPIGVNVPLGKSGNVEQVLDVIMAEGVGVVSISAGNPAPYIKALREKGLKVLVVAASVRHALSAERAGASAVIVEGYEAGGHNSPLELTTMAMVPQVSRAVKVPVVAAGGIADGGGLVAALALGASGVQLGTRFVATLESPAHENYKQALLMAADTDTVILERKFGRVTRVIKSAFTDKFLAREAEANQIEDLLELMSGSRNQQAALKGELAEGYAYAGQVAGLINSIPSAGELVGELIKEARAVAGGLAQLLQ